MCAPVLRWATLAAFAVTLPRLTADPPVKPEPAKPALDLHGDPLPQGAIARLGSVRFRHRGAVHEVAFSEDGKLLAASSDDVNMIIIWDRITGRKLREIPGDKNGPPWALRFSADGKRLYFQDKAFSAWDLDKVSQDFQPPPAETRALGYSPDGREVILLHKEAEIVRWDLEKGKERGRYPKQKDDNLEHLALVGERLLVPEFDGKSVSVWDAAEKKQLWSVEATKYDNGRALSMCFSADGKLFAVETPQNVISLYESISGKLIRRFKSDVTDVYWSVHISPDMKTIAASNWDGTIRLWDLETGKERVKIPTIEGHTTYVYFAPDSKSFATGGPNNAHGVLLWETSTGKHIEPYPGHSSPVRSVSFSPDGRTVATSSSMRGDAVVRLWDPQTGRLLKSLAAPSGGGIPAVVYSPDGGTLAAGSWFGDNNVRLWDVVRGRELRALAGHKARPICVALSPDGKRLVSGDDYINGMNKYEGRLYIWDVEAGKLLREIQGTPGAIQRVLFTRDGRQVIAAANGIHIYDADSGERIGEPFQERSRVWDIALSADGRLLATADGRGPVRLWELASRREIPLTVANSKSSHVALTADGRTLAANGRDGEVLLYHWPSEKVVGKLESNDCELEGIFFSPDCRRLATTTDRDSSVLIWDVAKLVNQPLPPVDKPAEKDLRRWWEELRNDDAGKAYKAVWRFAAAPEQALPFLTTSVQPIKAPDAAVVVGLIDDLDSSDFQVRQAASRKLEQMGEPVVEALRKKLAKGQPSAEQARRIKDLLEALARPMPGAEQLRATRALAALEQLGGPEAQKVFASLADGAPGTTVTREAKAALERLKGAEK